ncbi:winged helix DNA-binding domain-containing protein [Tsukamurella asaccharolytica]|uniref:Winged helix DNA-binding domain-containing protein n=1 Tax=Tsukamurella asaccharolytica TaxID=2592067 RepID=A0A5C5R6K4_9ACTN|nr:winged helix DNA-binding domain-containing protein [Tsukamurella asaccharolytica]TWS18004.1 winged helix DNA-binding domain-containing protein [Tsukamurella asaccharolytica]
MRLIDDAERRARLARRQALAPEHRTGSVLDAVRAVGVLHATEPATPYLSVHARMRDVARDDYERELWEERSLVKQLAMRRTMFVFPRALYGPALSGPSDRVAAQEHAKIVKDVEAAGIAADGAAWLARARDAVLEALRGRELSAQDLRETVPEIVGRVTRFEGKKYGGEMHLAPRVLTWLGAAGELVRGHNASHWRVNRNLWARADDWFGEEAARTDAAAAYAILVREYLRAFGPVTETDVVWWFGATKTAIRAALAEIGAVPVALERGGTGWVLPDDVDPEDPVEPWAALLPALDPTPMGWKERAFYLDPAFATAIYDSAGNAGTTAWWDGRIVGAYTQEDDGTVALVLPPGTPRAARKALDAEAARLQEWLAGERVNSLYKSPITLPAYGDGAARDADRG